MSSNYNNIAIDAVKMSNAELLNTFQSLRADGKFYTKILQESRRLEKPLSLRYKSAQENITELNEIGPKIATLIKDRGLKV